MKLENMTTDTKKNVNNFVQIKAMHELEGSPLDDYENHLLLLQSTNKISSDEAKKAFRKYLKDGTKTH